MATKPIKFILNPYAGRWKARARQSELEAILKDLQIPYELIVTTQPGEGTTVAREASQDGYETVVAVGGDSTVSEVMNGLLQAAGDQPARILGIIPLGTANDLADMLDLPRDLRAACQRIIANKTRLIDVGRVNGHFFGNNSAIGLEPIVTLEAEKINFIQGSLRYITAALRAIMRNPTWHVEMKWDTGAYRGPISLISIGNSPRTGGSFWMTPNALLDDGKLDVVFAPPLSRLSLLWLLPATFTGRHIHHDAVVSLRVSSLEIKTDPTPLQADGEILGREVTHLQYSLIPQKLRVIV
jgi:diacylglycerol kinase (ATP)